VLDEEGSDSRDGARALVAGTPHNSLTAGNRGLLSPRAKRWLELVGGGYVVVRCTGGESGCGGRSVGEAAGAGEAGAPLEEDEAVAGNGGEPAAVLAGDDLLELVSGEEMGLGVASKVAEAASTASCGRGISRWRAGLGSGRR
jgi:hypothetical protein